MSNKELIELYDLNKLGTHNTLKKQCLCGGEMDITEKSCPICKQMLPKSKLININKNSALARRFETSDDGIVAILSYKNLLSKGFELYETEALQFSLNRKTLEASISSSHVFKGLKQNERLIEFLETFEPGFYQFVMDCLKEMEHEYAVSNFTSLNESQIKSFLNVYINYRALIPHLLGYKILYFGSKLNLKEYLPEVDFCDENSIRKSGLVVELLKSWDLKNEKYFETILNISKTATENEKEILVDILNQMFQLRRVSYDDIINAFSLLYNSEISLKDFIRIYQNSRENFFFKIVDYRKNYKKMNKETIDWSRIEKLDRKQVNKMAVKCIIREDFKIKANKVEELYQTLEKNPMEALKSLIKLKEK